MFIDRVITKLKYLIIFLWEEKNLLWIRLYKSKIFDKAAELDILVERRVRQKKNQCYRPRFLEEEMRRGMSKGIDRFRSELEYGLVQLRM